MTRSRLSTGVFTAFLLLAGATALGGCSSSHLIADNLPAAAGGLPESVPARPEAPPEFPAVHHQPPARASATLTEAERKQLKEDLAATRDRAARQSPQPETIKTTQNTKKAKNNNKNTNKKANEKTETSEPVATGSTSAAGGAANP